MGEVAVVRSMRSYVSGMESCEMRLKTLVSF